MDAFVKPGQRVLIKPNLLTDRTPAQAVTTHPEVARAVIRQVKQAGGVPLVADSPANSTQLAAVWEKCGYRTLCEEEDIELLNLEKSGSETFDVQGLPVRIAKAVLEADVVINLPKVKTHVLTTLTAAVKNLYGTVPGYLKTHLHRERPGTTPFGKLVADIHDIVRPALSIADGIVGMEGNGPSGGRPIDLGFLGASTDAYALDVSLCRVLGISPATVPYLRGYLQSASVAGIELAGARVGDITPASFAAPSSLARLIPAWLAGLLGPLVWIRASVTEACVACGQCVKACPVDALVQEKGAPPVVQAKRCIGCCCCHEICPEKAIDMTQSLLLRLLRRGEGP